MCLGITYAKPPQLVRVWPLPVSVLSFAREEMASVLTTWLDGVPRPADEPTSAGTSTERNNVLPLQQPAAGQELEPASGTDQLEQRLRSCASAQEFGAVVADIKRLPEGEDKDQLRAVYAELRGARAAGEPAQGGAA